MTTTTYLWDAVSDDVLEEDDGVTTTVYTNEPSEFGDLVSQNDGADTHWYHFEARGDARELTDDTEGVTATRLYDAWGNVLASTGTTFMPFQFGGKSGYVFDALTQLNYVRARWYRASGGVWLSADTMRFVDGVNLHAAYFLPNQTDPSGTQVSSKPTIYKPNTTYSQYSHKISYCSTTLDSKPCCNSEDDDWCSFWFDATFSSEPQGDFKVVFTMGRESHGECQADLNRSKGGTITVQFGPGSKPCVVGESNFFQGGPNDGEFDPNSLSPECKQIMDLENTKGGTGSQVVFKLKRWTKVKWNIPMEYACECELDNNRRTSWRIWNLSHEVENGANS